MTSDVAATNPYVQVGAEAYNEILHLVPDRLIIKEAHLCWLIPPGSMPYDGTGLCAALH